MIELPPQWEKTVVAILEKYLPEYEILAFGSRVEGGRSCIRIWTWLSEDWRNRNGGESSALKTLSPNRTFLSV